MAGKSLKERLADAKAKAARSTHQTLIIERQAAAAERKKASQNAKDKK